MKRMLCLMIAAGLLSGTAWAAERAELAEMPEDLNELMHVSEAKMVEELNGWSDDLRQPRTFTAEDIDYSLVYPVYMEWDGSTLNGLDHPENAVWKLPVQTGDELIEFQFNISEDLLGDEARELAGEPESDAPRVGSWVYNGSGIYDPGTVDFNDRMEQYAEKGIIPEDSRYVFVSPNHRTEAALLIEDGEPTGAVLMYDLLLNDDAESLRTDRLYTIEELRAAIEQVQRDEEETEKEGMSHIWAALAAAVILGGAFLLYRRRSGKKS